MLPALVGRVVLRSQLRRLAVATGAALVELGAAIIERAADPMPAAARDAGRRELLRHVDDERRRRGM